MVKRVKGQSKRSMQGKGGAVRSPTPFYSKAQLKVSLANLVVEAGPSAFDWGDYNWLPTGHATRPGELVKAADFVNSVRSVAPSLYVDFKDLRDVISDLEMEYRTINAQRKPDFARSKAERALTVLHHVRRCMTADKLDAACSKVTKLQARRLLDMCRPVDEPATSECSAPRTPPRASVCAESEIPLGYSPGAGRIHDLPSPPSTAMKEAIERFKEFGHSPEKATCFAQALLGPPVPATKRETKKIAKAMKSSGSVLAKKPATRKLCRTPMPSPEKVIVDKETLSAECYTEKSYVRHQKPKRLLVQVTTKQTHDHARITKQLFAWAKKQARCTKAQMLSKRNELLSS